LQLFASEGSEGKWLETPFGAQPIRLLKPRKIPELDFAFLAVEASIAKRWAFRLARRGAIVIDKSSYFRDKPHIPLVTPEVNGEILFNYRGIIANPNCTVIPAVMALAPLHRLFGLKRFTAVSFQSVSGSGKEGLRALEHELEDENVQAACFPHRIAFNVIPWIGGRGRDGSSGEEIKMIQESRRILALPRLSAQTTSVRVPTRVGHAAAIHAEFRRAVDLERAREAWAGFPGLVVIDEPDKGEYPMPITAAGKDEVQVGRLRRVRGRCGIAFWVVTDNLRKGAATNAVQIAETVIKYS
ncbi:MAG: aspartate-semialdehyde dehydrogenase, partial [Calditrichota bacterium]